MNLLLVYGEPGLGHKVVYGSGGLGSRVQGLEFIAFQASKGFGFSAFRVLGCESVDRVPGRTLGPFSLLKLALKNVLGIVFESF